MPGIIFNPANVMLMLEQAQNVLQQYYDCICNLPVARLRRTVREKREDAQTRPHLGPIGVRVSFGKTRSWHKKHPI